MLSASSEMFNYHLAGWVGSRSLTMLLNLRFQRQCQILQRIGRASTYRVPVRDPEIKGRGFLPVRPLVLNDYASCSDCLTAVDSNTLCRSNFVSLYVQYVKSRGIKSSGCRMQKLIATCSHFGGASSVLAALSGLDNIQSFPKLHLFHLGSFHMRLQLYFLAHARKSLQCRL